MSVHRVWVEVWAAVEVGRGDRKEERGLRVWNKSQERV